MNEEQVEITNAKIKESINAFHRMNQNTDSEVLLKQILAEKNKEFLFGTLGKNLQNFIDLTDLNHPEMCMFLSNNLFSPEITKFLSDLITLCKYCKRKKLSITSKLKTLCETHLTDKAIIFLKNIENLFTSKVYTRFMEHDKRWSIRHCKKSTKIQTYKKLSNSENDDVNPNFFICYHHNSLAIKEVLDDLYTKENNFRNMSCRNMADETLAAIKRLESDLQCQSLGFHRITLNAVARNIHKIEEAKEYNEIRIHPVTQEWYHRNKHLNDLVGICENFPAYDSKYPVFDHYGVIKFDNANSGVLVGERDTQAFFIGYYHE